MMKLLGEGGTPNPLIIRGELKSSISLFSSTPVEEDMTMEPKLWKQNGEDLIITSTYFVNVIFLNIRIRTQSLIF